MASRPIKSIEVILLLPAFFNGVICLHFSFIFLRHYLFIPITTKRPVLTFYAIGKKQRIFSLWLCFNKSLFRNIPQSTTQSARTSNCFPVLFASDDEEFNPFLSPTSTQSSRVINNNDHSNLANHKTGGNDKPKLPILHQLSLENVSGLFVDYPQKVKITLNSYVLIRNFMMTLYPPKLVENKCSGTSHGSSMARYEKLHRAASSHLIL